MVIAIVRIVILSCIIVLCTSSEQTSQDSADIQKIIDGFSGLWSDFKKRILDQYTKLENFKADTAEVKLDVKKKINDTKEYLAMANQHQKELIEAGKNESIEQFDKSVEKMKTWLSDVDAFQKRVANATGNDLEDLKNEWNKKVEQDWNDGLNNVVDVSQKVDIKDKPAGGHAYKLTFTVWVLCLSCVVSFSLF